MPKRRRSKKAKLENPLLSPETAAIRDQLTTFYETIDASGRKPANATCGVYVFYDYDGEPIYVGQTYESVRGRIGRHLTNQRSDAVAMNVLDPFEVAEIEIYPFYDLVRQPGEEARRFSARVKPILRSAEYAVYRKVLEESAIHAVLNEKVINPAPIIELPPSHRGRIIPDEFYELRKHPDVRIARRASTVANLARVIAERGDVSPGLRKTLLTQAQRIKLLAEQRLNDILGAGASIPSEELLESEDDE